MLSMMAAVEGDAAVSALQLIHCLQLDVLEARDNLFTAKVVQAEFANRHRSPDDIFQTGDKVMLFNC